MKRKNTTFNAKFKGFDVINNPFLNKGTAFTAKERAALHLQGLLPDKIETLHEQVQRTYKQFQSYSTKLLQNIFLNELYNVNRNLFYKLVQSHVTEMLPIIYTPIVGNLVQQFSHEFRQQPRGLYISYQNRKHISEILDTYKNSEIDIIVVTDGEGVLGIGDQGVGSIEIPVAKLMLYTLFAGINPAKTIPIVLDVGTNNEALLNDPNYLGWRHSRIADKQYDKFIEEFVHTVKKKFPKVFFHWEDFGRDNAAKNLAKYQNFMCSFNDDIQGTGVVTLAAILAALGATRQNINEQRIVIFGAGSAGTGIADQIKSAMIRNGLAENEAIKNFWLLNSKGLVTDKSQNLTPNQKTYLRNSLEISSWQLQSQNKVDLFDVVKNVKPTILIGCSTVKGAFTKEIIIEMAKSTEIPMIFPLSNPNEKSEADSRKSVNCYRKPF
jgi:malate dehydrogenase (oxaloacetate-decarboxylating)